ncbi:gfo/Idh/MocA family oxidoreductase [Clostridiaceae bacterium]|nr:gfo/Idh/MocA family oxidoreductase [Clostridiaceae bacterium]
MKVCFIGFGSIAGRHIRNIKAMYGEKVQIDLFRSRQKEQDTDRLGDMIHEIYYDRDRLPCDYDVMFITNPTRLHYSTLMEFHCYGRHFFIEKPVFETGREDIKRLGLRPESVYYVACPLRYTNVIQYLRKNIDFSEIYSIRCISSSYLPDWRPGTDYRDSYSARKELGGGVSIDLIHEWDYLCYLLGEPERVKSMIARKSDLEIDSDDIAVYVAEYRDKLVELHLDYFGRVPVRKLELLGRREVIEADLIHERIRYRKSGSTVELAEERDAYQKRELEYFFRMIRQGTANPNSISRACRTLQIARGEW